MSFCPMGNEANDLESSHDNHIRHHIEQSIVNVQRTRAQHPTQLRIRLTTRQQVL